MCSDFISSWYVPEVQRNLPPHPAPRGHLFCVAHGCVCVAAPEQGTPPNCANISTWRVRTYRSSETWNALRCHIIIIRRCRQASRNTGVRSDKCLTLQCEQKADYAGYDNTTTDSFLSMTLWSLPWSQDESCRHTANGADSCMIRDPEAPGWGIVEAGDDRNVFASFQMSWFIPPLTVNNM